MTIKNNILREMMIYAFTMGNILRDTLRSVRLKTIMKDYQAQILGEEKAILTASPEVKPELDYIKSRNALSVFNAPFEEAYSHLNIQVFYDEAYSLKYIVHDHKKLYYPGSVRNTLLRETYRSIVCEQDRRSPHRYLDSGEDLQDAILFDCGCAEANFPLEVIEQVKAVYLFEGDETWFKPLRATFSPWKHKVALIRKFVGREGKQTISLRRYIEKLISAGKLDPENDKVFIKMDIEGSEVEVMKDILPLLGRFRHLRLAVCVYHRADHEQKIRALLPPGYTGRVRDGHMLFIAETDLPGGRLPAFPYFRHGVMRIERPDAET